MLFISLLFGTFKRLNLLSTLSTAEICPHNSVCFSHNWCIFSQKKSPHSFFLHPVRGQMARHEFHHYLFRLEGDGQTSRGGGLLGRLRLILRRLHVFVIICSCKFISVIELTQRFNCSENALFHRQVQNTGHRS